MKKDIYEYYLENNSEIAIIKKYFIFDSIENNVIYFFMSKKITRKIKLLIINNDSLSNILSKIIGKSILKQETRKCNMPTISSFNPSSATDCIFK